MVAKVSRDSVTGERVFLRLLTENEIDDRYLSWLEDQELVKYFSGSGRKFSREAIVKELNDGKASGTLYHYGVFDQASKLLIGSVKLGPIVPKHKISDLVVLIGDRAFHGKGLAVEAIRLGNQIAFEAFDLRKLYGGMYESNIASVKAYLKAGWIIEGRLKGQYWVDDKPMDRILVACFNPKYFSAEEIRAHAAKTPQA